MDAHCLTGPADVATPAASAPTARVAISLVMPAFNEEAVIERAIAEADRALAKLCDDYEIIVVDDGSSDRTAALARQSTSSHARLRVVSLDGNQGYGAALRAGFAAARMPYVAFTDADGQFHLDELDRLALLAPDYDLVCGYRIARQDPPLRVLCGKGYSLLVSALLGTRVRDCDCALKLMRRDALAKLDLQQSGYLINAELLAKARVAGLSLVEVGVTHRPRMAGASKVSLRQIVTVLAALLPFWWTYRMFPGGADDVDARRDEGFGRWHSWGLGALVVVAAALLFSRLNYPLIEPDEGRYALLAANMLESGDYIVPQRDEGPYLDKPPLLYWLTAASFAAFGVDDYAARFVTAGASLATLLATYWIGRRIVGRRAALMGAAALVLCAGFDLCGRFLVMDGLLTTWTTIAMLALHQATRPPRLRLGWWIVAAVACGLGVMTKGPICLVIALPPIVAWRWLNRMDDVRISAWRWFEFAVAVAVICVPWFVLVSVREESFVRHFFWEHHVVRFVASISHEGPWWYYIPVLAAGMFPTALLLPQLGAFLFRNSPGLRALRTRDLGYLALSAAWVIVFFSSSKGKLAPYILPALPPLCLLIGAMIERAYLAAAPDPYFERDRRRVFHLATLVGPICIVVFGLINISAIDANFAADSLSAAMIVAAVALWVIVWRMDLSAPSAKWLAGPALSAAALYFALATFQPELAEDRSVAIDVDPLRARFGGSKLPIVSYPRYEDSVVLTHPNERIEQFRVEQIGSLAKRLRGQRRALLLSTREAVPLVRMVIEESGTLRELDDRGRVYLYEALPPQVDSHALAGAAQTNLR